MQLNEIKKFPKNCRSLSTLLRMRQNRIKVPNTLLLPPPSCSTFRNRMTTMQTHQPSKYTKNSFATQYLPKTAVKCVWLLYLFGRKQALNYYLIFICFVECISNISDTSRPRDQIFAINQLVEIFANVKYQWLIPKFTKSRFTCIRYANQCEKQVNCGEQVEK